MASVDWAQVLLGTGAGGVIVAIINRFKSREERDALNATSDKDRAAGSADVIHAVTEAFTGVTGGLREEIERMKVDAGDLRQRAVQLESELDAALKTIGLMEQQLAEAKANAERLQADLDRAHGDLDRVRGERDLAQARVAQLEGELRQMQAVVTSAARVGTPTTD